MPHAEQIWWGQVRRAGEADGACEPLELLRYRRNELNEHEVWVIHCLRHGSYFHLPLHGRLTELASWAGPGGSAGPCT